MSWSHGEDVGEDVLDRGEDAADDHVRALRAEEREERLVVGVVDAAVTPGVAAEKAPAREHGSRTRPNSWSASSAYCEHDGWYLHVPLGVRSRPNVQRQAWTRPILRVLHDRTFARASETSAAEPVGSARLRRLREARGARRGRSRGRRDVREQLAPGLAQQPALHPVAHDRGAHGAGHREAEPRWAVLVFLPREPVQDEVPGRGGRPLPVDGVEVPRAGEPVAALHGRSELRRRGACAL